MRGSSGLADRAHALAAEFDERGDEGRAHADRVYRMLRREVRALRTLEEDVRSTEESIVDTLLRCSDATLEDVRPEIHRLLSLRQELLERVFGTLVEVRGVLSPSQLARALDPES